MTTFYQQQAANRRNSILLVLVVLALLVTWFGFGLGLIIRNSPATVSILLLWPLLIEGLLRVVFGLIGWDGLSDWLPYQAAIEAVTNRSAARWVRSGSPSSGSPSSRSARSSTTTATRRCSVSGRGARDGRAGRCGSCGRAARASRAG